VPFAPFRGNVRSAISAFSAVNMESVIYNLLPFLLVPLVPLRGHVLSPAGYPFFALVSSCLSGKELFAKIRNNWCNS
jgi:hypothetical protein